MNTLVRWLSKVPGRKVAPLPGPPRRGLGLWFLRDAMNDPLGSLQRLQAAYGPLCATHVLQHLVVDVFDPELARHLLVEHAPQVARWSRLPRVLARYHGPGSVLAAEGEPWSRLHRALAPLFAPRALQALAQDVASVADAALGRALGPRGEGRGVDVEQLFARTTLQVIERLLFGSNDWTDAQIYTLSGDVRTLSALLMREMFLPWPLLQRLPGRANRTRRNALQRLDAALCQRPVAVDALARLPADERRANLRTLFAAGYDTTAQTLQWWCCLMAHHPQALARAQVEIDAVLGGRPPTADDLTALPWLVGSIKEALRLYPVIPVLALRRLRDDLTLGAHVVPRGAFVRIAPWALQRDARAWPEPESFRPGRFMPGAVDVTRGAWLPFGAGPRACLGRHLALLEMGLVAAVLLQRCTPQPLAGAALPQARLDVVLRPRGGARLNLFPRAASGVVPTTASSTDRPVPGQGD